MPWYEKQFRRGLVDMHIEDWDARFFSELNPEVFVDMLKKGNIGAQMLYTQSHVGLCYWPTETGVMHQGLRGRENPIKRIEALCHENGINVIAYYSLVFNNREFDRHPEWRMRTIDGKDSRSTGNRYGLLCPNNPEYRAFTEQQIAEFCDYFDFEGIFFDMSFFPMPCYCDSCRARWEKEVGGEMPRRIDWKDPRWRLYQRKCSQWLGEFVQFATDTLHKYKPDATVEHQFASAVLHLESGVTENIALASDYSGGDLYGGIEEQSYACKLYYGCTKNQPFEYMTSRCYPALSEHTTTKSLDMLRLSVMMTYAHHGASLLIDAIDPVGTLDEAVYERIGQVFREAQPYEKYLSIGKQVFDVALYHDMYSRFDLEAPAVDAATPELDRRELPMQKALLGAAASLRSHHIPYGVVNNHWFDRFREAKVLVLSDVQDFDESKTDEILKYVENGGSLYMSGHCSQGLLKTLFDLEYCGWTDETVTYMSPTPAGEELMEGCFTYTHPLVMQEAMPLVQGEVNGTVLSTLTLPYTIPNPHSESMSPMIGRTMPYPENPDTKARMLRFAAIHSNPPGEFTTQPTMVHVRYGKGHAFWSAAPIERPNREQHREIFARIIKMLANDRFQFHAEAPEFVECVMFEGAEQGKKLMSILNLQDRFHIPAAHDITVSLPCSVAPTRVVLLPKETPLPFEWKNGEASVHFDTLPCCEMFMIES